ECARTRLPAQAGHGISRADIHAHQCAAAGSSFSQAFRARRKHDTRHALMLAAKSSYLVHDREGDNQSWSVSSERRTSLSEQADRRKSSIVAQQEFCRALTRRRYLAALKSGAFVFHSKPCR